MILKDYCEQVENTRAVLKNKGVDNIHMLFGMFTELGELTDVFKKQMAYGKEPDWINIKEELGDLMWYIAGFCNINEIDLEDVLQINISKLRTRYPEKFSTDNALNRDIDAERDSMKKPR